MADQWSRRQLLAATTASATVGILGGIARAQTPNWAYIDATTLPVIGRPFPQTTGWHRVEGEAYPDLPEVVKNLLKCPTGLAVAFTTAAPAIRARWSTIDGKQLANLTPIGERGLDLYIRREGKWIWAGVGRPGDGTTDNEDTLVQAMDGSVKECLLYLPTYKELTRLEIGVPAGSALRPLANPFRKRVVVYGSSIVHGAAASRPGMAYPARLERNLGVEFINLGLSGSAKMEPAAARLVADIDADAYVLDCVPNTNPKLIAERAGNLIRTLRDKRPDAPIIVVMSIIREVGNFNLRWKEQLRQQNATMLAEIHRLTDQHDLTVIPGEGLLGTDHEGEVDGTHPTDLGFDRMLKVIEPTLAKVLKAKGII